jgi:membrane-associated protease RseP (regulator of RpoE activity)
MLEKTEVALDCIAEVMTIQRQVFPQWDDIQHEDRAIIIQGGVDYLMTVEGQLTQDAESAYAHLDTTFQEHNLTALFRDHIASDGNHTHHIIVLDGRLQQPQPPSPIPNIVLLILTIVSLLYIGTATAVGEIGLSNPAAAEQISMNLLPNIWLGLPYTLSILLILGSHEMAHWFMMRKYNVVASLPYFIPGFIFSPFGTFGAVIITKGAIPNRKALFDIGASGPLAGLIFAIPILIIGLLGSPVIAVTGGSVEGNSILYAAAKFITLGQLYPTAHHDVMLNQFAWAGWTGLFVTALNLIPLGQLDGGHIMYAFFGDIARKFYYPILGVALFLTLFVSSIWLVLLIMLALLGKVYAVPLNSITKLDPTRKILAYLMLAIFILIFIPAPITTPDNSGGLLAGLLVIMSWQTIRNIWGR